MLRPTHCFSFGAKEATIFGVITLADGTVITPDGSEPQLEQSQGAADAIWIADVRQHSRHAHYFVITFQTFPLVGA
jgi:hypothetical protein